MPSFLNLPISINLVDEHKAMPCDSDKTGGFADFMDTVVVMDRFGRVLLPKKVRAAITGNRFVAELKGHNLVLVPVPTLQEAAGKFKVDFEKFKKQREEDKDE